VTGEANVRAHILVSGRVQGVGYRAFAHRVATQRGLVGGVRNLDDGRVELDVEGDRAVIEALLLEANLIKRLKPRFNVVLRDDKSFPFILIARDHPVPQILKHRGARNRKGDYFGPFASAGAVGRTINTLQRAFLLRSCSDAYYETRVRPCLLFQIKRCSAPCTGEISVEDYGALVDEALGFLRGESDEVKLRLHRLMDEASLKQDYERAASFRDRLTALSHIQSRQGINPLTLKGQIHGGVAQGVGQALMEQVVYEPGSGQLLTASFMEYAMPRADTFCDMVIESHPVPTKLNPLGAKGAGEAGTVGALPAVINAVLDALAPLGVRQLDMPASSDRVWQAIQRARAGGARPTA